MEKRTKNIFIWLFVWAGLLLAVLYSPIGSPDLYTTNNYFIPNSDVAFKGGEIENAPTSGFMFGSDNSTELDLPDYSSELKSNTHYSVNNYNTTSENSVSSTSYSVQKQSVPTFKNSSNDVGGGGSVFISNNHSRSSNSSYVTGLSGGITTLSTNLNTNNLVTNRQFASQATNDSIPDTGGDPPGDPIPVPDGWGFLIFLAVGYVIIKRALTQTAKNMN